MHMLSVIWIILIKAINKTYWRGNVNFNPSPLLLCPVVFLVENAIHFLTGQRVTFLEMKWDVVRKGKGLNSSQESFI